jgi:type III secretion system YscQ/HrcQ family protein
MISPYPWHALRRVTREALSAQREARQRIGRAVEVERLAAAAAEVLQMNVRFRLCDGSPAEHADWPALAFESAEGDALITLHPSPALAIAVLSRVLERPAPVVLSGRAADPVLIGALSSVGVEIARRTKGALPIRAKLAAPPALQALPLSVSVELDGRPYELLVSANAAWQPTRAAPATTLRALGALPICLALVIAVATIERAALAALEPGDAFLPGPAAGTDGGSVTAAALAGPLSEHGVAVTLTEAGELVVRGDMVALGVDGGSHMTDDGEATGGTMNRTALEAPIVVRVELGSVTLLAREWAELKPGDVIETGRRIAEPVVLRVAGQEVARGELVNVDGELGVRIQSLVTESGT